MFLKKNAQKYPQMVMVHRFGCEEKNCNFVGENEYCSLLVEAIKSLRVRQMFGCSTTLGHLSFSLFALSVSQSLKSCFSPTTNRPK